MKLQATPKSLIHTDNKTKNHCNKDQDIPERCHTSSTAGRTMEAPRRYCKQALKEGVTRVPRQLFSFFFFFLLFYYFITSSFYSQLLLLSVTLIISNQFSITLIIGSPNYQHLLFSVSLIWEATEIPKTMY